MNNDFYPSRGGRKAELIPRKDPVVYRDDFDNAPVEREFIQKYKEQGFVILKNLFSEGEVESFQAELERFKNDAALKSSENSITEASSGEVRSVFKVHEISPVFKRVAADRRLAGLASFLLDDDVYIHQSRVNYKPGFQGKEFYWHSDFETWHVEDGLPRMRTLSMSIALSENYCYNGALMLIPGSQMDFAVCEGDTPENHYKSSLRKQEAGIPNNESLREMVDKGGIVTATGKPGDVIVFDSNTMHGSSGNITPYPRSNIFFVYNAVSNRVVEPFCDQPPRPEYICTRENIEPIIIQ